MRSYTRAVVVAVAIVAMSLAVTRPVRGAEAPSVEKNAEAALKKLYASQGAAEELGPKAKAILVFPNIVKAGFLAGAHYGEGVLFKGGQPAGRYSSVAGSFGLQAGVQVFGYAMFLMTDKALEYLDRSDGWEVGIGPSVVAVNTGVAKSITTTTIKDDVYAFIFNQQGLMAGLGLQGSKITKLK